MAGAHRTGRDGGYDTAAGRDLQALFLIRSTCEFFAELEADGREPQYHGDRVARRDFDEVLMSWRLEDGRRRIVWGDLRTSTAAGDTGQAR